VEPELPVTLILHVPEAPPPVLVGASLAISALTKAVVAICVVLVVTAAVGAVGVPVKAGDARGAFALSWVWTFEVTPSTKFKSATVEVRPVSVVALDALVADVAVAAFPLMAIAHVPEASPPVRVGTLRLVRAVPASEAPVPPFATTRVPARVTAPVVSVEGVRPVVPAEKDVTPPPEDAIVIVSVVASVVMLMPEPATKVSVSAVLSATTFV
jgi:hypothetical protein